MCKREQRRTKAQGHWRGYHRGNERGDLKPTPSTRNGRARRPAHPKPTEPPNRRHTCAHPCALKELTSSSRAARGRLKKCFGSHHFFDGRGSPHAGLDCCHDAAIDMVILPHSKALISDESPRERPPKAPATSRWEPGTAGTSICQSFLAVGRCGRRILDE